jgi:alanine dehydrogenase
MKRLSIGLPRQHKEPGEKRDFLPRFVARLEGFGLRVLLERGYGSGMGYSEKDYLQLAPSVQFGSEEETYAQDYVLVLRYPRDEVISRMRPPGCLLSMVHFPTRPERIDVLRALGVEAISLDSVKDDSGRRLVENLKAVAWNGVEAAVRVLNSIYPPPGFESASRPPLRVTLLGAGAVGTQVLRAAINYGDERLRRRLAEAGVPGVLVSVVDYDLTNQPDSMQELLSRTDILIDATQRLDLTRPVIPNAWIAALPEHAVLLDLSVDPYDCSLDRAFVKGIEGVPQGNLDQYVFPPDDPAYNQMPSCADARNRRYVVSCYSWPGIHPEQCMQVYGRQLRPLLRTLAEKGGYQQINPQGNFFERAIARAQLSRWTSELQA